MQKNPQELKKIEQSFDYYNRTKDFFCSIAYDIGGDAVEVGQLNSQKNFSEIKTLDELEMKSRRVFKMQNRTRGVRSPWSSSRSYGRR